MSEEWKLVSDLLDKQDCHVVVYPIWNDTPYGSFRISKDQQNNMFKFLHSLSRYRYAKENLYRYRNLHLSVNDSKKNYYRIDKLVHASTSICTLSAVKRSRCTPDQFPSLDKYHEEVSLKHTIFHIEDLTVKFTYQDDFITFTIEVKGKSGSTKNRFESIMKKVYSI